MKMEDLRPKINTENIWEKFENWRQATYQKIVKFEESLSHTICKIY